jgi:pimeloyl-ACP methyl ester carboxylesterase
VPIVVVAGEEDVGSPPELAIKAQGQIPGARLERIRAGHTVPLEQLEPVARSLVASLGTTSRP